MAINNERDIEANMQIGPTDLGMVRIFIEAGEQALEEAGLEVTRGDAGL